MGDMKYAPFIEKYANIFREQNVEYDIIFWNRDCTEKDFPSNCKAYRNYMELDIPTIQKFKGFWGFRKFCKSCIKKEKYDKLVALTTLSAFFIFDTLIWKYRGKYIFDIRDFSYENLGFFRMIEKWMIQKSSYTVISSPYFKEFLPDGYKYIICHNHDKRDDNIIRTETARKQHGINLGFVGSLRYFEHQKHIIDALANDERFLLSYYGTGPQFERFARYKLDRNIDNMFLYGGFTQWEINGILQQVDILNNSYGYAEGGFHPEIQYAMSNKYYSGLQWRIPQLVEVGSCKCRRVECLNLGIGIDVADVNFADKLYDYYLSYDENLLCKEADAELKRINQEEDMFYSAIKEFVKDGSDNE